MSRVREIAILAGLDPRHAVSVRGIGDALADQMLSHAIAGLDADAIVAALGAPEIADGYLRRPLAASDAATMVAFLAQVRRRLSDRNRALDREAETVDSLFRALAGATDA
jgi:hypothetical protein